MNAEKWNAIADQVSAKRVDFDSLAKFLINETQLLVFGSPCRLLEIEFYLQSKQHPDPFVHCDQAQQSFARWYLHRVGGTLKNGSFKGLDLAVGDGDSYFGILIRSLGTPAGVVCGPCLCVNYMIDAGELGSVRELSDAIEPTGFHKKTKPVRFVENDFSEAEPIYSCPRVGLSTKHESDQHSKFAARNYRYMVRPRDIKKGRPELIKGLSSHGFTNAKIRELTGSPIRTIEKYTAAASH